MLNKDLPNWSVLNTLSLATSTSLLRTFFLFCFHTWNTNWSLKILPLMSLLENVRNKSVTGMAKTSPLPHLDWCHWTSSERAVKNISTASTMTVQIRPSHGNWFSPEMHLVVAKETQLLPLFIYLINCFYSTILFLINIINAYFWRKGMSRIFWYKWKQSPQTNPLTPLKMSLLRSFFFFFSAA